MSGPAAPTARKVSWGKTLAMVATVLLAFALLYFSLRGIDWRGAWELIRQAQLPLLAVSVFLASISLFLRALRWRILLIAKRPIAVGTAFWATSAGYFGNNFLPARAGELVRTFMIVSRSGLSTPFVLTTALSERVSDAVALVAISATVLLAMPNPPGWLSHVARPFAILGLGGVAAIALAPAFQDAGHHMLARLPFPLRLRTKATDVFDHAMQGIRAFHDLRRLMAFVGMTAGIWFLDATATIAGARAVHLRLSYSIAFLLIAGLGLGSALPSTPGYVGIYQFVAVSVLVPFGFTRTDSIAYILLAQVVSYVTIGFWGSLGFWKYRRTKETREPPMTEAGGR